MSAHLYSLPTAFPTPDDDLAAPVPPIEAVLFDFANTLFRMLPTERFLSRIWERAGRGPHTIDAAEVAAQVRAAAALPHVIEAQHLRDTSAERHRAATLAWFHEVPALAGVEESAYEQVLLAETWYPYPDAAPVLRELSARGIPVGIVSDIPFDLRENVAEHGLADYVTGYALSYELGLEKPDPRMFLKACADLGADPRRTLMVGDNAPRDGGAVTANLRVYLLPSEPRTGARGLDAVLRLLG